MKWPKIYNGLHLPSEKI